jgi:hypothetical protein
VVKFLRTAPGLDKQKIGEYLGAAGKEVVPLLTTTTTITTTTTATGATTTTTTTTVAGAADGDGAEEDGGEVAAAAAAATATAGESSSEPTTTSSADDAAGSSGDGGFSTLTKDGEVVYLGDTAPFHAAVLKAFGDSFNFKRQPLVVALRMFLSSFRLPGEAQQIDRVVQAFGTFVYLQMDVAALFCLFHELYFYFRHANEQFFSLFAFIIPLKCSSFQPTRRSSTA